VSEDLIAIRRPLETAMQEMAKIWPIKFNTSEISRCLNIFARPLRGIDPDCLMVAAHEWMDKNKWAPTPSEFARYAWKVHKDTHPTQPMEVTNPSMRDPEVIRIGERVRDTQVSLDKRAQYILECMDAPKAIDRLRQVSDVWALLWDRATNKEEREAVQTGTVSRKVINEAIRAYRSGERARDYRMLRRAETVQFTPQQDSEAATA
jgi:hypothetical protein